MTEGLEEPIAVSPAGRPRRTTTTSGAGCGRSSCSSTRCGLADGQRPDSRTRIDWAEEVRRLLDEDYPDARRVMLVCDTEHAREGISV